MTKIITGRLAASILLLLLPAMAFSAEKENSASSSETGAFTLYSTAGWSFGLPAVQAVVSVPGVGSVASPEKKTLPMYGFGAGVRAWKFLVPFAELSAIDTGKAYAQIGTLRSEAQADTFSFIGGFKLMPGGHSRLRPYAEIGGGLLHQKVSGTFYEDGSAIPVNGSASASLIKYGAGVQIYWSKKWGSVIGFDGYHVGTPMNGAGQNYSSVKLGVFFQTKSSVM